MVWQPNAHVWCVGHQIQKSDVHQHFEVTPRSWCASVKETCATWDQHFIFLHYFWFCHQFYHSYSDDACIGIVFCNIYTDSYVKTLFVQCLYPIRSNTKSSQDESSCFQALCAFKNYFYQFTIKARKFIKCQITRFKFQSHIHSHFYCFIFNPKSLNSWTVSWIWMTNTLTQIS